jgi:hypothetical protein
MPLIEIAFAAAGKKIIMKKTILLILAGLFLAGTAPAQDMTVIVYNSNVGLIRKTIELNLTPGAQTVSYTGVPGRIDPTSVLLEAQQGSVRILEQNFRYDTANSQQMLREYINREIFVYLEGGTAVRGTLVSAEGDLVLRGAEGRIVVVRLDKIERIEFPPPQGEMVNQPTLVWTLTSDRSGKTPLRLSYLTEGLAWHSEYTAIVNANETAIDLSALASLENNSGERYENAQLRLVAGEINRVPTPRPVAKLARGMATMEAAAADYEESFAERGLFEYHIYDLQGRTTVNQGEVKQIALFAPKSVPVERQYVFNANRYRQDIMTVLKFTNAEKTGPGVPLPAGRVRIYKPDGGVNIYIGEDTMDHTPVGGDVRLAVGRAFELSGEHRVMDTRSISNRINEQDVEIVLRNRKKEQATVTAVEFLQGVWEITRSTHKYERKNVNTVEFTVPVPASGETTIRYTVRFTY